jgi:Alpha/beta hydrolase domain
VMKGTLPPDSVYPTLNGKHADASAGRGATRGRNVPDLVEANKAAMGFPTIPTAALPQLTGVAANWRATLPEADFIMPVLDYDWGPAFNATDATGVPSNAPPPIKQVIKMLVPRVDADGNEVGGVPVVLNDAPLGTYLGWNVTGPGGPAPAPATGITPRPFHQGQICNYVGGMIPFAKTQAERLATGDPRLSLEERYGNHAGYVAAVRTAAARAVASGFLLQADADALIAGAEASQVLK